MPRGGYRPGAGRKKDKKVESTAFSLKAREFAEFYRRILDRARNGIKPTAKEKEQMNTLSAELAVLLDEANIGGQEPEIENLCPLDFLLKIMNNPKEDKELRIRVATAAAPYCHVRKGEGAGKKEEKADRANEAGKGKFAPARAPISVVK